MISGLVRIWILYPRVAGAILNIDMTMKLTKKVSPTEDRLQIDGIHAAARSFSIWIDRPT